MECSLTQKRCLPCEGGVPKLDTAAVKKLHMQLNSWEVIENRLLRKTFKSPDFITALKLADRIGYLAEEEGHHPDLHISWGKLTVETWTHAAGGLTENDFVLAAKIDRLAQGA